MYFHHVLNGTHGRPLIRFPSERTALMSLFSRSPPASARSPPASVAGVATLLLGTWSLFDDAAVNKPSLECKERTELSLLWTCRAKGADVGDPARESDKGVSAATTDPGVEVRIAWCRLNFCSLFNSNFKEFVCPRSLSSSCNCLTWSEWQAQRIGDTSGEARSNKD